MTIFAPQVRLDAPRTEEIRVASVPASHVYVRHCAPEQERPGRASVRRLADPDPASPDRSTVERWWPPVMLTPEWIAAHDFDILHLQFGFDAWAPADLADVVAALRRKGRPFVYTVHDLRNPHHLDRRLHDEQLDVLVPAADELITLTSGAAAEIRRRWGREATVLPHPHVVDLATMAQLTRQRRPREEFRVGLHVKSVRASMDPLRLLPTLIETVRSLPGGVLQVNGHRDVLDRDGASRHHELADLLERAAADGDLELHVHDFLPDEQLWRYLSSLDVSVLPYRFGTHSGWLEACRDLGTAVVAPDCGYFAEQGPVQTYHHAEEEFDAATLAAALRRAYAGRDEVAPISLEERRAQRALIAQRHEELYTRVLR